MRYTAFQRWLYWMSDHLIHFISIMNSERKWRQRNARRRKTERTKLASIRTYKNSLQLKNYSLIFLVYAAAEAASHRATLQQFIKFISFNWKSLTLHSFFLSQSHIGKCSLMMMMILFLTAVLFSNAFIFATLAAFEEAEGSEGKEQKLVDENYISMTEINF